jgi:DNA-binding PadR family transcriptional regulator
MHQERNELMLHYGKSRHGPAKGLHAIWGRGEHLGGGRHRGERGGRGGRGGRRRVFDGGELRLILLKLVSDGPRHGYDLIREIEALSGGAYAPSPGVVYPTLTLLWDMGLITEGEADGARRRFAISDAGVAHLTEQAEAVTVAFAKLTAMNEQSERTDGRQVRRALGNLREAIEIRLGGDAVSQETLHAVTALIDEAAQKIERV